MSDAEHNPLIDAGLRRKLSAEERTRLDVLLAANPSQRAAWEEELSLNLLLRQLPDKPLASNFTAQVLQAIHRDSLAHSQIARVGWWQWLTAHGWITKAAFASLIVTTGLLSYHEHQMRTRTELARSVAKVSNVASLVSADVLENFDAINRLGQVPTQMDDDLYRALK